MFSSHKITFSWNFPIFISCCLRRHFRSGNRQLGICFRHSWTLWKTTIANAPDIWTREVQDQMKKFCPQCELHNSILPTYGRRQLGNEERLKYSSIFYWHVGCESLSLIIRSWVYPMENFVSIKYLLLKFREGRGNHATFRVTSIYIWRIKLLRFGKFLIGRLTSWEASGGIHATKATISSILRFSFYLK